jgi:Tol biopolymer transport system component
MKSERYSKFLAGLVTSLIILSLVISPALAIAGDTTRVSVVSGGTQADGQSEFPSISANGRYVAFTSSASDLVSGDTNGSRDVFVHNRLNGQTTRSSVASNGKEGNDRSEFPSISADGRYVAFQSYASNLVSDDTNDWPDIFVHDLQEGGTTRVSVASDSTQANGRSDYPSISADGRYVAFQSYASNLVSGDTNNRDDEIYVHDRQTGITTRVSVASDGTETNGGVSEVPSISANGRYVAFQSDASNLVSDDTNGKMDIFVHDLQTGTTTRVSVASNGTQGNSESNEPSISADGRYVAFQSFASNLVSDDINGQMDIFVHDRQVGTTTRVSVASNGTQGNYSSHYPSISADGRFVAFQSDSYNLVSGDTNGTWDVFTHDLRSGQTVRVSVASNGAQAIGGVSEVPSISADGRYVAFESYASNLVSGDTNGYPDIFVHENDVVAIVQKPPLIIVHGFQGLLTTGGYHCSNDGIGWNDIQEYDGTDPSLSTLGSLPDWFLPDYQVWIAHLESTPSGTPSLQTNSECLRDQINYVAQQNPDNPITIVAHSMGGLVSRAAIRNLDAGVDIEALYTLGSPHAGLPTEYLALLPETVTCIIQPAACQMSAPYMESGFNTFNPNINGVKYAFIGGNGGSGFLSEILTKLGQGPNDGLVGNSSAVGWVFPDQFFAPLTWPNDSLPGQYFTNETHPAQSDPNKAYYTAQDGQGFSDAFLCIKALMAGDNPNSQDICWPALQLASLATPASFTEPQTGHLDAGLSTTILLTIDAGDSTLFYLTWSGGNAPSFTLNRPDGHPIDPAHVSENPGEVSYETAAAGPSTPPFVAYKFVSATIGTWQLNITATDAIDYRTFGLMDSERTLVAQTNSDTYKIGDIAALTATLKNGGVGISGATVTAILTRPDAGGDIVPLTDQSDGTYTGDYDIPDSSGYLSIDVTASGTDGGIAFTRQSHLQVTIQSDNLQLTIGGYGDTPNDDNADGLYEKLDFTAEVELASPGKYAVMADLYAGDQFVTQTGDFFNLITGTQTITLPFDGAAIRESMLNGPYTITNLSLTPLDTGITAQSAINVHTTSAYSYNQFGYCYPLTLGHGGLGDNPVASPPNSAGCNFGFIPGEVISVTASPAIDWKIGGWTGTDDDTSTASTNTVTMPARDRIANVIYSQIEYSLTIVSANGTVTKNPDQATYHEGDVVQLTSKPNAGWAFFNWTGGLIGIANPGSVTIHGDTSVTANYKKTTTLPLSSIAAHDGWVLEKGEKLNTGGTLNATSTIFRLGDDNLKKQYRSILSFKTSGLPDTAVITSVTLKIKQQSVTGRATFKMFQGLLVDIRRGTFGTPALQLTDFRATANKTGIGPFTAPAVGGWYTFDLTTAKGYINKLATNSGLTQFRLRFKLDDNNNAIANYISFFSGNSATNKPRLIIQYYVP